MTDHPLRFTPSLPVVDVEVPKATSTAPSVLGFSHHKAGSTMLFEILAALAPAAGLTFVNIPGDLFRRGIAPRLVQVNANLSPVGHCYGGFRFFPPYARTLLEAARSVLLVRDPRDALVSHYFSVRDSHPLPAVDGTATRSLLDARERASHQTIDEWAIESHGVAADNLAGYVAQGFLQRENIAIYRYEDIIYRKEEWIADMIAFLGWRIASRKVADVARSFDTFPKTSDPSRHIRQVHPGNFRTALKPETQAKLEIALRTPLKTFGYMD